MENILAAPLADWLFKKFRGIYGNILTRKGSWSKKTQRGRCQSFEIWWVQVPFTPTASVNTEGSGERKRHTDLGVSSTPSAVLSRGEGFPSPARGCTPSWAPPSWPGQGVPHARDVPIQSTYSPNLAGRVPHPWMGGTHPCIGEYPILDKGGVPRPDLAWSGVPPWKRPWTSHWGTPPEKGHGSSGSIMGWRWGTPLQVWTDRHLWKQPTIILGTCAYRKAQFQLEFADSVWV